ncbi:MAG TPA: segregation/condensation protein A [Patescibacteria group bacterium]|nr:segregation/condensation protein A [Patescibacteria group bacterium]
MAYHIHLEQFEGPLDLLLSFIEKEKLDITQVSLVTVTDQYITYLRSQKSSLESFASFLTIAARLILIKSRALLPMLEFSDEEEEAMDDLEWRLKEYKRFREAAGTLGTLLAKKHYAYHRESFLGTRVVFYPPQTLTPSILRTHFENVLGAIPLFEALPEKEIGAIITLEEKIFSLQKILSENGKTSFVHLMHIASDRVEIVISFLAILEMVKQQTVSVEQVGFFGDIHIQQL